MTIIQTISRLVKDPPPEHAFEISEAGISYAYRTTTSFEAFEPGTIVVSPSVDNILRPDVVASMIGAIAPANGAKKRRQAALILPDYAARVTVLDFDSFPSVAAEQLPLVKFRIKKTVPFDIESAAVSFLCNRLREGRRSKCWRLRWRSILWLGMKRCFARRDFIRAR